VKEERKANKLDTRTAPKGFEKDKVKPPLHINKEKHAGQATKFSQERIKSQAHVIE